MYVRKTLSTENRLEASSRIFPANTNQKCALTSLSKGNSEEYMIPLEPINMMKMYYGVQATH